MTNRDDTPAGGRNGSVPYRTTSYDQVVASALRDLPVPEHETGFLSRLEAGMDALDDRRAARLPATLRTTARPAPDAAGGPPRSSQTGGVTRRAGDRPRPSGRLHLPDRLRLPLLVPAAAMILLAILWAWGGPASPSRLWDRLSVAPATAAEITQKVTAALAGVRSLRAELVVIEPDGPDALTHQMRWEVSTTVAGDFRLGGTNTLSDGTARTEELAYNASTGTERSYSRESSEAGGDAPSFGGERRGLAAGRPDPGPSDWELDRQLGSFARALVAAQETATGSPEGQAATVQETTYEGSPVWVLETPVRPNLISGVSGDRLEVTVDQETGFPLKIVETRSGELVQEIRLENIEIDATFPPAWFTLDLPTDVEVARSDEGFRRIDVADTAAVAALVGYEPPAPAWLPEGFALAEATAAVSGGPTGTEGMNPPTGGVVSLAYRRGLDRFVISLRPVGEDPAAWADPLASGEGYVDTPERIIIADGAFAGAGAEILIDPLSVPHLWAMNDDLVVTVAGDLSRQELVKLAESLTSESPARGSVGD